MKSLNTRTSNWIKWALVLFFVILIKWFSLNKERVEVYYTEGFYPLISNILRIFFGWIPFSFGDVLYILAGCWLLYKFLKNSKLLFARGIKRPVFYSKLANTVLIIFTLYITFNIFWGLNYNRQGITYQLGLSDQSYDTSDVRIIEKLLLQKVNFSKTTLLKSHSVYPSKKDLFKRAEASYEEASKRYPFLKSKHPSVKSSMFGRIGNYLGFTGYYNPFTGEAQVNTSVPEFLQPYITTHEMGHQIGYAKEDEASFVGYLASVNSNDTLFCYSTYLDLFMYANREVYFFDSVSSKQSYNLLTEPVKKDIEDWQKFVRHHQTFIEPGITWMYGKFLKLNEQPKGMRSYNAVISMLIAYYKKYGTI